MEVRTWEGWGWWVGEVGQGLTEVKNEAALGVFGRAAASPGSCCAVESLDAAVPV